MAMKKVNCTLSVVCCVSLISMAIVMFVLYAQLLGEYQQLQHQYASISNGLNQSNKVIADMKIELTNLTVNLNETQELLKNSITGGQSCQEILANGKTRNGVYMITGTGTPFGAYCLEKLYQFTKTGKHQLRVDLVAYDGDTAYAIYDDFSIGVGPGYQLHIGKYSGTAGDALTYHNNMKFSTPDNDNDADSSGNCAETHKGAFWYKGCYYVNINAINYKGTGTKGMRWWDFKGNNPMKETTMMVL